MFRVIFTTFGGERRTERVAADTVQAAREVICARFGFACTFHSTRREK